jgi:preprotein translocase subunit SecA
LFRKIDELAGGLSPEEAFLVKTALNERLERHGLAPAFSMETGDETEDWEDDEPEPEPAQPPVKVGRNDPCPCGSGKKYKNCHGKTVPVN